MVEAVIEAGANVVNIPDTVGYAIPDEWYEKIASIMENVPNIKKVILSVHCHNDLGLATANSLLAVKAGARQVECTINGIGERAGNAAMEEIVMTLKTRNDIFTGYSTNINTKEMSDEASSESKAFEVNEYLAKIQALVYKYFYPPANSQGNTVKAVITLSAIGKVQDFRILNYSVNKSLNDECDKVKNRLLNVVFPKNPQHVSGTYTIILTAKE